jgi:integrase/recombinase XerD
MSVSMQEPAGRELAVVERWPTAVSRAAPYSIHAAGQAATFAWDEFFQGKIRNKHTRIAYMRCVRRFLDWAAPREPALARITPGMVGEYFDQLPVSVPSKKLHLAAIRAFFDVLVQRHAVVLNPALSVRTERYSAVEGRTPEITVEQARKLLEAIPLVSVVDYRDRAVIAVLIYTAARAGAVGGLRCRDFSEEGTQFVLRFAEKGGKARSIPVRHDLQAFLQEYLRIAGIELAPKDSPLFRSVDRSRQRLTDRPLSGVDICRLVKRRLALALLPKNISPHSFRSCAATDLLLQRVALEDVQYLLGHADARTTRLYDRRQKQVTRNIVEKISV